MRERKRKIVSGLLDKAIVEPACTVDYGIPEHTCRAGTYILINNCVFVTIITDKTEVMSSKYKCLRLFENVFDCEVFIKNCVVA